ncbi:1,4-dihydroxy-2-naphthoate polyprenyltransferase [Klugiella sp. YN-L-19]|uniref:1,4-dihydroxy-2-naphthoate octaprenyltransferase n=1 Tax=Ruicaihuangia caeni TaxID=3042517 RepID=A0AAW6T4Z1_9MICO|nr:1,4-dihydroxy-2-naphthoate polyprenyltransferase [Klugiella sp. YN-L-19]MDI2098900.1 1,4-dihydroxy-2-naphthoate polyprenyltransferase [Klugiella sp. YN-L-19]
MAKPRPQRIDPDRLNRANAARNERAAQQKSLAGGSTAAGPSAKSKSNSSTKGRNSGNPAARNAAPKGAAQKRQPAKATWRDWVAGARIRTLSLSVAPVALGSAAAHVAGGFDLTIALLCLGVAVLLQIGVNYANDYSDGVRGTDQFRVGPSRLTGSGAAAPKHVLTVALVCFALGAACGLAIVVLTQLWWLLAVGALALLAAWFYTGGKRPYGYAGLGELVSFLFFGPVATAGTTFVQLGSVNLESWFAGLAMGLFTAAVMLINNLRDRVPDSQAGKKTLAVRMGDRPARALFAVLVLAPFGVLVFFALFYLWAPLVYLALLVAIPAAVIGVWGKTAAEALLALKLTSLAALLYGLALAAAIAF